MSSVDSSAALQLKEPASFIQAELGGEWRGALDELRRISPFAYAADALAEAGRVAALQGHPLAVDRVPVAGRRRDLIGRVGILRGAELGYEAGVPVFVLSVEEREADTLLRVIRKL